MAKICYTPRRFSDSSRALIEKANEIIEQYEAEGYELTLRQLYYQFVARDLIANKQSEYKRLGSVINDARLAGLVDWQAIVDRTRNLQGNNHWAAPREIVEASARQYQIDKWQDQPYRIEVWVEKDALVGVLERACRKLDVSFFSCRGYTSQSELWAASQRLVEYAREGQKTVVIHLGDHDPSGIDMTRDIRDRLNLFMVRTGHLAKVERIALNMDQVRKYNPPPNPAKLTDSRVGGYIKKFGSKSWELDALDPKVIDALIKETALNYRDEKLWEKALRKEKSHRMALEDVVDDLEKKGL